MHGSFLQIHAPFQLIHDIISTDQWIFSPDPLIFSADLHTFSGDPLNLFKTDLLNRFPLLFLLFRYFYLLDLFRIDLNQNIADELIKLYRAFITLET